MSGNGEQSTDGESIKPVSSLRSHFEGLQIKKGGGVTTHETKEPRKASITAERLDVAPQSNLRKASLDLPRPDSPWSSSKNTGLIAPHAPGEQRTRGLSPPKSSHKRPLSMLVQSSPQLTPSVIVDSPRSPPKSYFPSRNSSRSPERVIGKVKELISHHSSRSSTRPGSPRQDNVDHVQGEGHQEGHSAKGPPASNTPESRAPTIPPPVNRAEKPKIPAKPAPLVAQDLTGLVPQPRRASTNDAKVSPFSTPPSSDESPPLHATPSLQIVSDITERLQKASDRGVPSPHHDISHPTSAQSVRPNDPRMMGFSKTSTPSERRDPRTLGLSGSPIRPPSRENASFPTRANTVSERPPSRDPREFGTSMGRPTVRHVSESVRPTPPPSHIHHPVPQRQAAIRDARQFGFSGHTGPTANVDELRPDLPPRRTDSMPPPRPSEDSKRPPSRPIMQPSPPAPVDRSTKPINLGQASTPIMPLPSTNVFLPPPRRNAFDPPDSPTYRSGAVKSSERSIPPQPPLEDDSDEAEEIIEESSTFKTEYPDVSQSSRRPPIIKGELYELPIKSDPRVYDICGQFLCTGGYVTKIFDLTSGEQIMGLNHGETVKVLSVVFKPAQERESEGSRVWIGNNIGELHEIDIATHSTIATSTSHNRREIIRMIRCRRDIWTLDDEGKLFVWRADESGVPSLKYSHISDRVQKGHTFSMAVNERFWLATGKEIRIYRPGKEPSAVLPKPLVQAGTGEITSGTYTSKYGGRAYFGHTDGKVTIYSTKDYTCLSNVKASDYRINGLAFVGDWLWAAYKTGKIYVYDTSTTPWKVKKDWKAHDGPAAGLVLDPSSVWTLSRLQVTSVGHDNYVRLWDGMLEDDWLENVMQENDTDYCSFREVRAAVVTWNVGAINPAELRGDFIADAIHADDPPEVLAFGFQEVVDLEDRAVTAKSLLGFGKKKDVVKTEQHQSRVYREWRDYLSRFINRHVGVHWNYSELCTSSLVGLFQCVFIRQEERDNVRSLSANNVKCGMKGRYGNKGALITRFILDDSSLCFVNCHLAAGQTQTSHRNNDIATILEAESLLPERNPDTRASLFVGGGDGTQILDHEICVLNGDLNYRIDAMPRNTVVDLVKRGDLTRLLERDQLMVCRRRVSGFRLSPFTELPITFAPTYKYDVGTDNYDTSEKKRAPAWCDRLLYRGPGRIKQIEYRRHEVKVSDHRPVSGVFKIRLKTIDQSKRGRVREKCEQMFADVKRRLAEEASVEYLMGRLGVGEQEAKALIVKAS